MKKQLLLIIYLSLASLMQAQVNKNLNVSNPGTIGTLLTATEKSTVQNLTLTGTIDARDFKFMRDSLPALIVIDLKSATIAAYTGTEGTDCSVTFASYEADAIPQFAFCVKVIYEYVPYPLFNGKNIKSITLPESITTIGNSAFRGCYSLDSMNIPKTVISINESAFNGCGLKKVTIPSSVQTIGSCAFRFCVNIPLIELSESVKSIGGGAFIGCNISVSSQNPYFTVIDSVLYNSNQTSLLQSFSTSKNFTIPSTVSSIEPYAFIDRPIVSIDIPSSVTSIGNGAFFDAFNLKTVTIPSSVTSIGDSTFAYCFALQSIVIPSSVTTIDDYAFYNVGLKSIVVPEAITSIGKHAFEYSKLESVSLPANLLTIGDSAFRNSIYLKKVSIPQNASLTSFGNSAFANCSVDSITIPSSVITIGDESFNQCSISSISLPSSLTSIGNNAFSMCKIDSVFIPSTVSNIGYNAFSGCPLKSLTLSPSIKIIRQGTFYSYIGKSPIYISANVDSIAPYAFPSGCNLIIDKLNKKYVSIDGVVYNRDTTIVILCSASKKGEYIMPTSVKTIKDGAFSNCAGLTSILLSPKLTSIGYIAFASDSLISTITIPASVSLIKDRAFNRKISFIVDDKNQVYSSNDGLLFNKNKTMVLQCPTIKIGEYKIPSTVTNIYPYAFEDCNKLTSIVIPTSVDTIGSGAFVGCSSLKTITIPASITSLCDWSFGNCVNLKSIIIMNPQPLDFASSNCIDYDGNPSVFANVSLSKCMLFVPVGSKVSYKKAEGWKKFLIMYEGTSLTIDLSDSLVNLANSNKITKSINVKTGASWKAQSLASWLTVSPNSVAGNGTLVLSADSNTSFATRMTIVNIIANDTSVSPRTIMIVQKGSLKTAISELSSDVLQVFPNPATSYFSIQTVEKAIVSIYNSKGDLQKTQTVEPGESISINNFSEGLYFVKIQLGENTVTRSLQIIK